MIPDRTPANCEAQNEIAKSTKAVLIRRIARLVRQEGIDYEGWRYVAKKVRQVCRLKPERRGRKLPNVLTIEEFRRFYQAVDRADNAQHALMLRLLFYTGVRVAELCAIEIADIDLEACRIRINEGKGQKDRVVLFGRSFATAEYVCVLQWSRLASKCPLHRPAVWAKACAAGFLFFPFGFYFLASDSTRG
jgi:integrase